MSERTVCGGLAHRSGGSGEAMSERTVVGVSLIAWVGAVGR